MESVSEYNCLPGKPLEMILYKSSEEKASSPLKRKLTFIHENFLFTQINRVFNLKIICNLNAN